MTRQDLLSELEKCATSHGFVFRTDPVHGINARIGNGPEIWAEMPELLKQDGREEGIRTYRIALRMACLTKNNGTGEQLLNGMTGSLPEIALAMCGNDDIVDIPSMEYTTEKDTLTNRGEVSVKATLTIKTRF